MRPAQANGGGLTGAFLDWWFSPWLYAGAAAPPHMADRLACRDGYRLWCSAAAIRPDLPEHFDPAWQTLAATESGTLLEAARLFAGLLLARRQQIGALATLEPLQRAWCLRVASVQPLGGDEGLPFDAADPLELRGLAVLSRYVEAAFPNLWARVHLSLPAELSHRLSELFLAAGSPDPLSPGGAAPVAVSSAARALRCWELCRQRALAGAAR
jgi:hypothetical protein